MRGFTRWAALGILLVPLAASAASQTIEVRAQLDAMSIPGEARLALPQGLFHVEIDRTKIGSDPFASIAGGTTTVYQFYQNASVVRDPFTGGDVVQLYDYVQSRELACDPTSMTLLYPTDAPDIRIFFQTLSGYTFPAARDASLATSTPVAELQRPRAITSTDLGVLQNYEDVPPESGWLTFAPGNVEGSGTVGFLIDGWTVRLVGNGCSEVVETGTRMHHAHRFGEGGHHTDVYSFLVITVHGGDHAFDPDQIRFRGHAPAPQLAWNGPATINVLRGDLVVDGRTIPLNQHQLLLTGDFRGDLQFGQDAALAGASFHAAGTGTSSAFEPLEAGTGLGTVAQQAGVWSTVALGLLTVGVLGAQTLRRPGPARGMPPAAAPAPPGAQPPAPPATRPTTLEGLIAHVKKEPLDGDAQFTLGVELVRGGHSDVGLRHLDRSFRLQPASILRLLEDPDLAAVRDRHEVRQLLGRFQKEQQRRVWAGYA